MIRSRKIDKSKLALPAETKIRNEKHRRWIASLPCLITRIEGNSQAAHIRSGNSAGMGLKSGDDCCVPLSIAEHARQGRDGEVVFWAWHGGVEKATKLAKDLYAVSGDTAEALKLINAWRTA